jgi:hypothetical protein
MADICIGLALPFFMMMFKEEETEKKVTSY